MKRILCLLMTACLLLAGCAGQNPPSSTGQGTEVPGGGATDQPAVSEGTTDQPAVSEGTTAQPAVSEVTTDQPAVSEGTTEQAAVSEEPAEDPVSVPEITDEEYEKMKFNGNGEKLIDALYEKKQDNVVISNTSINIALSMLLEGANGETQKQIEDYLGVTKEEAKELNKKLLALLNSHGEDGLQINVANSVWCGENKEIKEDYINLLREYFGAQTEKVDFSDDKTADLINEWCSDKTKGLIKKIADAGQLKAADLALMLLNAIYFKGVWETPYDEVEEGTFNGNPADVLRGSESKYFENDKAIAFAKEYRGGYEFIGILPKEEGEFTVADLDIKGLLENMTQHYTVETQIPLFEMEYETGLESILPQLGIEDVFTADCDLTDIGDELQVGRVTHKTYMKLDEKGTEAAAVTSIMVTEGAMMKEPEVKEVILDRPFVFMLYDLRTDTALFTGKIVNLD